MVGGGPTLRDSLDKKQPARWQKGAAGEYVLYETLARELTNGERILPALSLPDGPRDIDCIVVASSGVWVLDAKYWRGRVKYGGKHLFDSGWHLLVGGVDHTEEVARIYQAVIPVAQIVANPAVPVHRAWVFVYADWAAPHVLRILLRMKPLRHDGVWIGTAGSICRAIQKAGPVSREQIEALSEQLRSSLGHR